MYNFPLIQQPLSFLLKKKNRQAHRFFLALAYFYATNILADGTNQRKLPRKHKTNSTLPPPFLTAVNAEKVKMPHELKAKINEF